MPDKEPGLPNTPNPLSVFYAERIAAILKSNRVTEEVIEKTTQEVLVLEPKLISTQVAAAICDVKLTRLYQLEEQGIIPRHVGELPGNRRIYERTGIEKAHKNRNWFPGRPKKSS